MADEDATARYRNLYAKLLRLYPTSFRERFGEGMEQTFNDLLRDRAEEGRGLVGSALRMFLETSRGILRENMGAVMKLDGNIIRIVLVTGLILLIPLVAMQFTDEVAWGPLDFAVAGALLLGAGLTYELVARKRGNLEYRVAVGVAVGTALLLVWLNLAVGIIGNEENPANLMYLGVLSVGLIGSILARLWPRGMARALLATALAHALVTVIALIAGFGSSWIGSVKTLVLNGFFVALWLTAGWLFRKAEREHPPAVARPEGTA